MPDYLQADWLSTQFDSFQRFFSQEDPTPELSLQSVFNNYRALFQQSDWDISAQPNNPDICIVTNRSFLRKLSFSSIYYKEINQGENKQTINIPSPTPDGEFILHSNGLKANRYLMIMDIARSPGIHYRVRDTKTVILKELIFKPLIGKQYKYIIDKNNEKSNYPRSNPVGENFSNIGKKQIAHQLGPGASIAIENPILTQEEFDAIIKLFESDQLTETDERSWMNLKVNLISDHLCKIFHNWLVEIDTRYNYKKHVQPIRLLQKNIDNFFINSDLFQLVDSTNPLSEISQKRRLTLTNHPGFPSKGLLLEKRDIHPTDFGRVCSIESPQGKKLGFNLYLTKDAKISSLGAIETPFNDICSGEGVFFDPFTEAEKVKAVRTAGEAGSNQVTFIKKPAGEVLLPGKDDTITHETITNHNFLGYSASLIPFIQHNDGCRALMGANMMKQAVLLRNPEPPLVKTGLEAEIAAKYPQSQSPFIKDNQLCLGRNLLVGYMPWDLLNYEDGIVISDRLARDLSHIENEDIIFDQMDDEIIDLGSIVTVGTELSADMSLMKKSRVLTEADNKYFHLGVKGKTEDIFLRAPSDLFGVVKERFLYASPKLQKEVMEIEKDFKVQFTRKLPGKSALRVILRVEKAYPMKVGDKLTGRHGNKGVVSAILPEPEMPYFLCEKNECSDLDCKISEPHTHLEVMLNPLGITGRMNVGQLYETALGWIAKHTAESEGKKVIPFSNEWSWQKIKSVMAENNLRPKQKLFYCRNGVVTEIGDNPPSGGQITVGYQYMMKLRHFAGKKITSRSQDGREYDQAMGQPIIPKSPPTDMKKIWENRNSRKRKAQRIGEMEVWALQGHSAWNIIDEFLFLKSDAEKDRSHFLESVEGIESESDRIANPQREHRALKTLVHYCRGLGLEIEALDTDFNRIELVGPFAPEYWPELESLSIRIATEDERKAWAKGNEINSIGGDKKDKKVDGLWSNEIFGDSKNPTDGRLGNSYGIIRLPVPIDNPIFSNFFRAILGEKHPTIGVTQLHDFVKNYDWGNAVKENKKKPKFVALIKQIIDKKYTPDDFFIQNLLVLPKSLRVEIKDISDNNYPRYLNDLNYLYKEIIAITQKIKSNIEKDKSYLYNGTPASSDPSTDVGMFSDIDSFNNDEKFCDIYYPSTVKKLRRLVHVLLVNGKIMPFSYKFPFVRKNYDKPCNSILATVSGYRISKNGIIRKHLLGKRADFSGRAVIVPDPDLGLNEAGIPYKMAKTLFYPMIIQKYLNAYPGADVNNAKEFLGNKDNEMDVRNWLRDILSQSFIILNRAPSLHRLSMLSFRPRIRDNGDVLRINPYVCKAYNADFDGDTMSIFVPMLPESKAEAEGMLPSNCLMSPANGKLLISHNADIGLGWYFLCKNNFSGWEELKSVMGINRTNDNDLQKHLEESYKNNQDFEKGLKSFTNEIRPVLNKHGITIGLDDFLVKDEISNAISKATEMICEKVGQTSLDIQSKLIQSELDNIKNKLSAECLTETSNLRDLIYSGAAKIDMMQLVGMKSYQLKPGGDKVPFPILSNIFEGLSPLEYFNSCHGARYGLADKGLSTAVAGGLTNILIQAVQDVSVTEEDCGTENGLYLSDFSDEDAGKILLQDRIINRCLAEDIKTKNGLIEKGTIIDDLEMANEISEIYNWVKIRSPIFCETKNGICKKCYGYDLATGKPPINGYPAGIIAAQSIGEPGTQMVLKSFHTAGTAGKEPGLGVEKARKIFSGKMKEKMPNQDLPILKDPERTASKNITEDATKANAAEALLFALQGVYNSISKIADHHFEVIIRKMLFDGKIRGIIKVGNQDPGILAKLSFRNLPKVLMEAALSGTPDGFHGLKEKIIAGKKIASR